MKIILENNDAKLSLNTHGAYIEKFKIKDEMIFFPNVQFKIDDVLKPRGGMHPCLPNFGADASGKLAQHGFGRELDWDIVNRTDNSITLSLVGEKDYYKMNFTIYYELSKDSLYVKLNIENNGKSLPIAPGFHPYFYSKDQQIDIEGYKIDKEKLEDTIFISTNDIKFKTSNRTISIKVKENVGRYAVWSDKKSDYICVEPTFNGNSFTNNSDEPLILENGQSFNMEFEIKA